MHPRVVFHRVGAVVLRRRDFLAVGIHPRQLAAAVHDESLIRARIGHYALPGTHEEILRATRVGGLAAGWSAGDVFGWWRPPAVPTQVWVPRAASRLRDAADGRSRRSAPWPSDILLDWSDLVRQPDARSGVIAPIDAVRQVVESAPTHHSVAVIDSALHSGMLRPDHLREIASRHPRTAVLLDSVDGAAESGTESVVRQVLVEAGFAPRTQVRIHGIGRVDLQVGQRIVIEVDSKEWHGSPEQRTRDYRRDLALIARGYLVIRVSYQQALYDHPSIVAAVTGALLATSCP